MPRRTLAFDESSFDPVPPEKIQEIYASGFCGVARDEVAEALFANPSVTPHVRDILNDRFGDAIDLAKGKLVAPYKATVNAIPDWGPAEAQLTGDCLIGETPITMADGSTKRLDKVEEGELVETHQGNHKPVIRTIEKPYQGDMIRLIIDDDTHVKVTPDHKLLTADKVWTEAEKLEEGSVIFTTHSAGPLMPIARVHIRHNRDCTVHCLEVEDDQSFIAGGIVVHNCVGHAVRNAGEVEDTVDAAIGLEGQQWPQGQRYSVEVIYGCRGWAGQGANCSTLVRCVSIGQQSGYLIRGKYGGYDLSSYNSATSRLQHSWGRGGPPRELLELAKQTQAKQAIRVDNWDDLVAALAMGMTIVTCGSRGFSNRRNEDGLSGLKGNWSHSMLICGADLRDEAVRKYGGKTLWKHDWGRFNSGPRVDDQPEGSWWVSQRDTMAYLRSGSYHGVGDVERISRHASDRAAGVAGL